MRPNRLINLIEQSPAASSTSRRTFVRQLAWGAAAGLSGTLAACGGGGSDNGTDPQVQYLHGVASGDPLTDRVILWTRVSPVSVFVGDIAVQWEVASDNGFQRIVAQGQARTSVDQDYTVKVDVAGLQPASVYYYRFRVATQASQVGRTKTLPQGAVKQVKLAVFSCANFPQGFFNVYGDAATHADVDAAVHLGDYIYEYEKGVYASPQAAAMGRVVDPVNETVTLKDYRLRHAQYKTDAQLQKLHAQMPMIAVWDDHEICNDTWRDGAENHQPSAEGDFAVRKAAAIKAYHEWMPTRVGRAEIIYRSFAFGDLLALHMLDTRVIGRDQQLDYAKLLSVPAAQLPATLQAALGDPARELMGSTQTAWLQQGMAASRATWQVLGQQVVMGRMNVPAPLLLGFMGLPGGVSVSEYLRIATLARTRPEQLTAADKAVLAQPSIPYNLDAWDGYAAARERVLAMSQQLGKNLVVLSGDTHNAWASVLKTQGGAAVGVEFATASVSSPGFDANLSIEPPVLKNALETLIPDLRYCDTARRGYMIVTATPEACTSQWIYVDTVTSTTYKASADASWKVLAGRPGELVKA